MDNLVCVRIYNKRVEAEIARGFLETNGIKAVVSSNDAGGAYPFPFHTGGGVKLLVRKEDEKRVNEILEQYFHEILEKAERGEK